MLMSAVAFRRYSGFASAALFSKIKEMFDN